MAQETETLAMELAMASCNACDLMFIASERRQTCPTCGGEAVGPYFEFVLDGDGLHQKDGAVGVVPPMPIADERREMVEAPPVPVPAEEETPVGEGIALAPSDVLPLTIESYLRGGEATEDDVENVLRDLGADREDAKMAVGRLVAVRGFIEELTGVGVEPEVEVEAEVSPEAAPETSLGDDNEPEAP